MSYSLNEVEATAKRATRGAGYAWGVAEDAAKATRWLCSHNLDGVAHLARLLGASERNAPTSIDGDWTGEGALCPLQVGCLLSDSAHLLNDGPIRIQTLAEPALLLPFAALAARQLNAVVSVDCEGQVAVTDGQIFAAPAGFPKVAATVTITLGGTLPASSPPKTRATLEPSDWDALNRFAHKTYAPATEESRLLGAGAGLSDND